MTLMSMPESEEPKPASKRFPDTSKVNLPGKLRALRRRRAKNKMRRVSRNKNQ